MVHPDHSKTSAHAGPARQPEDPGETESPRVPESEDSASQGTMATAHPGLSETGAAPEASSPRATRKAAAHSGAGPAAEGASPATAVLSRDLTTLEKRQGVPGHHSDALQTTGTLVPGNCWGSALPQGTDSGSARAPRASPSLPSPSDKAPEGCGGASGPGCPRGSGSSPVTDIDRLLEELDASGARLPPPAKGARLSRERAAPGPQRAESDPDSGSQAPGPRRPAAAGPAPCPQWAHQPSVLDSINPDRHFTVNKSFLSSYSRNLSSLHEDSIRRCRAWATARSRPSRPCTEMLRTRLRTPSRSLKPHELPPGTAGPVLVFVLVLMGLLTRETRQSLRKSRLKSVPRMAPPIHPQPALLPLPRGPPALPSPKPCHRSTEP